jgi:hypothetical protein
MSTANRNATPPALEAALAYADLGLRVFPAHYITTDTCSCGKADCLSPGKHPTTAHGLKDATCDAAQIRQWWRQWPGANVAIATGKDSGFFVVGPDGEQGVKDLAMLEAFNARLPATPRARSGSGSGSCHHYFRWPAAGTVTNRKNHNGLAIDVRGEGGYVIAPPSNHISGGSYAWEVGFDDAPLAEAPPWMLDWVRGGKGGKKAGDFGCKVEGARDAAIRYLAKVDPSVSGQGGHDAALWAARVVVLGFDLGPDVGFELLWAHWNDRCTPPWSEKELRHKCSEAHVVPFDKPRGWLLNESGRNGTVAHAGEGRRDADPPSPQWPDPPGVCAYHGLAGDIVRTILPHTEADGVAILAQTLVAFGNAVGGAKDRGPYFRVGADRHYLNEFVIVVGDTSKGRKGMSWNEVREAVGPADLTWRDRIKDGASSGEGLIWAVRDPIKARQPVKKNGRVVDYEEVETDPGVKDKRLMLVESEFASVLRRMEGRGNTLSAVLRQGWDRGDLHTLTKNSPACATNAHISVVGHITSQELRRYLTATESANGFANRFWWLLSRKSKDLPLGGSVPPDELACLTDRLRDAVGFAREAREVVFDRRAEADWCAAYPTLSAGRPGLAGAMLSRAEAHVRRVACLYALLDQSSAILPGHLAAALELWHYCERSVAHVFGDAVGDRTADDIRAALKEVGREGMRRTEIVELFQRNRSADEIDRALALLLEYQLAHYREEKTATKPATRWFYGKG